MNAIRFKLCVMMFLQFFIWGAWFLLVSDYLTDLKFTPLEKSFALNAWALASITALFFSNQFADRNFAAEKFLAFSHLIGGLCIFALAFTKSFPVFFLLLLGHSLFYVPTISITNSIAFANLQDAKKDFGPVRLWGTIGWIAASWPSIFILANWSKIPGLGEVSFVKWLGAIFDPENSSKGEAYLTGVSWMFIVAGVASLVLAVFSLTLPHTPPKPIKEGENRFAWLEAMRLLGKPFVLVLFIVTLIDAMVHQGYFVLTASFLKNKVGIPAQWIMPVMSIGQIAEVATMAVLGLVLKSLGWRTTMVLGVLGHAARFATFAFFPEPAPAILINVLHGICYAFFFATVYIFVDEFFPKDARASAQGLFNFLILGLGPFVGNYVWPHLEGVFKIGEVVDEKGALLYPIIDYQKLFLVPTGTALVAALLLLIFFRPPEKAVAEAPSFPEEIPESV
jgi:nucleoside transporter